MDPIRPEKAYKNLDFLNSPQARHIRILCEYEEPQQRFRDANVRDTIVFFGSARARAADDAAQMLKDAEAAVKAGLPDAAKLLGRAKSAVALSRYYDEARELARRLTEWDLSRKGKRDYYVATGGGPGIMEAANRGAADVQGGRSVGLGISLPFEPGVNPYVTKSLAFEFHYFFTRKYWFMYLMKAMLVFPGGYGTLDEMFEVLTLMQTGKVTKRVPLMLYGTEYWDKVLGLQAMTEYGTISLDDPDMVFKCDDVDTAFNWIVAELERVESEE